MRFEKIPYSQVIASAKMMLNLENSTDYDSFFLLMADEAMRQINDLSMFEFKTANIPLEDGTAPLPCGFMQVMAVWFTSAAGRCTLAPYVAKNIVNYCDCDTTGCPSLGTSYQINGNHIVFHNPDAMTADEVTIAYLSILLDDNNQPQMYERHERAVREYLMWRYKEKNAPKNTNITIRQIMNAEAAKHERKFGLQKKHLQARAVVEGWKEDKQSISRMFNAWIGTENRYSIN